MKWVESKENLSNYPQSFQERMNRDKNIPPFTDENVILHDLEEISDKNLKIMRNNILIQIYYGICLCYMKESNYYEAVSVIEEALTINNLSAFLYFRRAQVLSLNSDSYLFDFYQAKVDIFQARELIFTERKRNQQQKKIVNTDSFFETIIDQTFLNLQKIIDEKIEIRKKLEKSLVKRTIIINILLNFSFSNDATDPRIFCKGESR